MVSSMNAESYWSCFYKVALCVTAIALVGCGARRSIFRAYEITNDRVTSVLVDAKQRGIFAIPVPYVTEDSQNRRVIVCAEPSPDVLSVVSNSIIASIEGGLSGGETAKAEFANLFREIGRQLGERATTTQLLRDGLYRQCEAYMNGVISQEDYRRLVNRYVDGMVTLLAIERITPRPTVGNKTL